MRPRTLDEVAGHPELLGSRGFLRRAIAEDRVPSLIFWGPPGCGKTTLARLIAESTKSRFVPFSAVTSGIKEIKEVMADAVKLRTATGRRTILFVDEIHRFNRAQQDAFLPYVERGDIVLVGATTENPSFELNAALLSRCKVVMLQALGSGGAGGDAAPRARPARARPRRERGSRSATRRSARSPQLANGDGRRALGLLELAVSEAVAAGLAAVTVEGVAQLAQRKVLLYDKSGEEHFNLISALHKSLRESDPDAALYWLGRMLAAGEDPNYLARRLVRFASEDVGLADPQALPQALAGWASYERLGSPEGEVALAQVVDLPRAGAEERRGLSRLRRRAPGDRGAPGRAGAARAAQRPDEADEGARLRPRLRLCPGLGGGRRRPRVPAGGARRDDLLQPLGQGLRSQARRTAGGVRAPARGGSRAQRRPLASLG